MPIYEMADDLWWGKGRGCNFTHHYTCPMGEASTNMTGEFCAFADVPNSYGCDAFGDNPTQCSTTISQFTETCPIESDRTSWFGDCNDLPGNPQFDPLQQMMTTQFQQRKGPGSKCFRYKSFNVKGWDSTADYNYYPVCFEAICNRDPQTSEVTSIVITVGDSTVTCTDQN